MSWQRPINVHKIQSFLGLANYYRRFVEGLSKLSTPLTALTKRFIEGFSRLPHSQYLILGKNAWQQGKSCIVTLNLHVS